MSWPTPTSSGSTHEKRWQDVDTLLDAGIDVITTVNIQHLESVNDVVEKITGIHQQETIPDAIVRRAEQIEIVDVTPEALRRRMAHGNIYAADKIDASLSNYFRVGNLSALRELALLWLADRVEDSCSATSTTTTIHQTWETRERLIVGVTGTATDEDLLRRAARIASRTGAELFAVHVVKADEIRHVPTDTSEARELVEEFEGHFQEVVEDDIATALVAFARSERGTQIVLGRQPAATSVASGERRRREGTAPRARPRRPHHRGWRANDRPTSTDVVRRASLVQRRRGRDRHRGSSLPLLTVVMTRDPLERLAVDGVLGLPRGSSRPDDVGRRAGRRGRRPSRLRSGELLLRQTVPHPGGRAPRRRRGPRRLPALRGRGQRDRQSIRRKARTRRSAPAPRPQILAGAAASVAASHEDLRPLLESLRAVFAASSVAGRRARRRVASDLVQRRADRVVEAGLSFEIDEEHRLYVRGATLNDQDNQLVSAFARRMAAGLRSQIIARDAIATPRDGRSGVTSTGALSNGVEGVARSAREGAGQHLALAGSHELRSLDERNAVLERH